MKLRFRLLLLAALVLLVVAGSTAAREETKTQDGDESADLEADSAKSKKQKDDVQPDSGKVRVKQKWQRHKPPSSKKAKKAALRKEKALPKGGKEKWKAAAEEARQKKVERDAKRGQKWAKGSEAKSVRAEGKKLEVDKLGQAKRGKRDKREANQDSGVCAKDELCASGSDETVGSEKKKWKRKDSGREKTKEKSAQLNGVGDENASGGTEGVANGRMDSVETVGSERKKWKKKHGGGEKAKDKSAQLNWVGDEDPSDGTEGVVANGRVDSDETVGSEMKKRKRKDSGEEKTKEKSAQLNGVGDEDPSDETGSVVADERIEGKNKERKQRTAEHGEQAVKPKRRKAEEASPTKLKVRRYIVEEEVIEEGADEEQEAIESDEALQLME